MPLLSFPVTTVIRESVCVCGPSAYECRCSGSEREIEVSGTVFYSVEDEEVKEVKDIQSVEFLDRQQMSEAEEALVDASWKWIDGWKKGREAA